MIDLKAIDKTSNMAITFSRYQIKLKLFQSFMSKNRWLKKLY